jgi:DNA-binding NarL/FixJ family response regulator
VKPSDSSSRIAGALDVAVWCAPGRPVLNPSIVDALITRHEGVAIDDLGLRELDVLELIADGLSNRGIASILNVSIKAVEKHVTAIFRKLQLADPSLVDRRVTAALTYQHARTGPLVLRHHGPHEERDVFGPRT